MTIFVLPIHKSAINKIVAKIYFKFRLRIILNEQTI